MSILRRMGMANFGRVAAGGGGGTYSFTSGFAEVPTAFACPDLLWGYQTAYAGSISPSTLSGYTIATLAKTIGQLEDFEGICVPVTGNGSFSFRLSGYSGASNLFTSITIPLSGGGTRTYNSSSAFYSVAGGFGNWTWGWADTTQTPATGTVTIV